MTGAPDLKWRILQLLELLPKFSDIADWYSRLPSTSMPQLASTDSFPCMIWKWLHSQSTSGLLGIKRSPSRNFFGVFWGVFFGDLSLHGDLVFFPGVNVWVLLDTLLFTRLREVVWRGDKGFPDEDKFLSLSFLCQRGMGPFESGASSFFKQSLTPFSNSNWAISSLNSMLKNMQWRINWLRVNTFLSFITV